MIYNSKKQWLMDIDIVSLERQKTPPRLTEYANKSWKIDNEKFIVVLCKYAKHNIDLK